VQHPPLAGCSNARFAPDGFEVFTPGDCDRTKSAPRYLGWVPSSRPSTHPIIIKHTVADLQEYVPRRLLERQFHVLSGARASLDE